MVLAAQEKITVILPKVLKHEVAQLKEILHVSMNSIYQTAIAEYVAKKKREQLRKEAMMMVIEYNENPEIQELIDIQEELSRIKIHLEKFDKLMTSDHEIGRELEFLLQELNRETNTIGSKSSSGVISASVVQMKVELEKMREQVLNLE